MNRVLLSSAGIGQRLPGGQASHLYACSSFDVAAPAPIFSAQAAWWLELMKNHHARYALYAFAFVLLSLSQTEFATAGTPQNTAMPITSAKQVTVELMHVASGYTLIGQGYARTIFLAFAGAYLVTALVQSILQGASDIRAPMGLLLAEMMKLGVFGFLVNAGPQIATIIIDSLHMVGQKMSASQGNGTAVGPQLIMDQMVALAYPGGGTFAFAIWELQGAAFLLTLLVTYCIAGMIIVAEVDGYIMLGAGSVVLGCGGAQWTRSFATGYFMLAGSAGLRLLFMEAVQGIVLRFVLSWKVQADLDGEIKPELILSMFGCTIVLLILTLRANNYATNLGSKIGSGPDSLLARIPSTVLATSVSAGAAGAWRQMSRGAASATRATSAALSSGAASPFRGGPGGVAPPGTFEGGLGAAGQRTVGAGAGAGGARGAATTGSAGANAAKDGAAQGASHVSSRAADESGHPRSGSASSGEGNNAEHSSSRQSGSDRGEAAARGDSGARREAANTGGRSTNARGSADRSKAGEKVGGDQTRTEQARGAAGANKSASHGAARADGASGDEAQQGFETTRGAQAQSNGREPDDAIGGSSSSAAGARSTTADVGSGRDAGRDDAGAAAGRGPWLESSTPASYAASALEDESDSGGAAPVSSAPQHPAGGAAPVSSAPQHPAAGARDAQHGHSIAGSGVASAGNGSGSGAGRSGSAGGASYVGSRVSGSASAPSARGAASAPGSWSSSSAGMRSSSDRSVDPGPVTVSQAPSGSGAAAPGREAKRSGGDRSAAVPPRQGPTSAQKALRGDRDA